MRESNPLPYRTEPVEMDSSGVEPEVGATQPTRPTRKKRERAMGIEPTTFSLEG